MATTPITAPKDSAALTQELSSFDKSAQNPIDIYNSALENLGISDARSRVTSLRKSLIDNQNLLSGLAGSIQGRTANSLVTEAQRQRLYNMEQAPIVDSANKLNQGLGLAQADESSILGQAQQTTNLAIQGQQTQRQALMDRLKLAIDTETNAENKRRWQTEYDYQVAQNKKEFDYKVKQDKLDRASGGGGGGSTKTTTKTIKSNVPYTIGLKGVGDGQGNMKYTVGGKTYSVKAGYNPFTGTKNADVSKGAFSNGYQPDNIGGKKLTASGGKMTVNGQSQNVWKSAANTYWVWDGKKNKYVRV